MVKFKITYDRDACIGAAACAAIDSRFTMNADGKADLAPSKEEKPGLFILELDEIGDMQDAAESCPVDAIKVEEVK